MGKVKHRTKAKRKGKEEEDKECGLGQLSIQRVREPYARQMMSQM